MKPDQGNQLPTKRGIIDYLDQLDHKLAAQGTKATSELYDVSFQYSYTTHEITGFDAFRTKTPGKTHRSCCADFTIQILGCEFRWQGDDILHDKGARSYSHPELEDGEPLLDATGHPLDMEKALGQALDAHIETLCPCHQGPLLSRAHVLDALEAADPLGESHFIRFGSSKTGPVLYIHDHGHPIKGLEQIDLETAAEILVRQNLPVEIAGA